MYKQTYIRGSLCINTIAMTKHILSYTDNSLLIDIDKIIAIDH